MLSIVGNNEIQPIKSGNLVLIANAEIYNYEKLLLDYNLDNFKTNSDCEIILKSKRYTSCTTLLAYMPLPDEVDVTPVIEDALKCGKKVYLPRIFPETSLMEFYRYDGTDALNEGSFGIREPEINEAQSFSRVIEAMSINEYAGITSPPVPAVSPGISKGSP